MIDTWTTTQPMAAGRPCPHDGTGSLAASSGVVSARFRGTGLPSDAYNGADVAATDKGTISSSRAWSPPV
jgi:hypothetical protein